MQGLNSTITSINANRSPAAQFAQELRRLAAEVERGRVSVVLAAFIQNGGVQRLRFDPE